MLRLSLGLGLASQGASSAPPSAPANTVLPAITGSAVQGQTLTASTGAWTGTAPITYAFQWKADGAAISGATASTYTLTASEVGKAMTVTVTASNAGGSTAATSAATSSVLPLAPANTVLPAITGSAVEGQTLTASTGTWSNSPTSYAYQWKRSGSNIGGATASTYLLVGADVGHTITVTVTATNAGGSTAATSNATSAVAAVDANFANVSLLLGFEGSNGATSTTDESPTTPRTFTFEGNAQISTAQKPFGSSSLLLDGTGDRLSASANSDFSFTGQFTIEFWVRFNGVPGAHTGLISSYDANVSGERWYITYLAGGTLRVNAWPAGDPHHTFDSSWTPTTLTWHNITVDRDATNKIRVYVDGVLKNSWTDSVVFGSAGEFEIGSFVDAGYANFNGHMKEIRFTKGVARYASDSGFTVATSAFPRQGP